MTVSLGDAAVNAEAAATGALLNSGKMRFYTDPRPATVDTAITTQTKLGEATFNATAFGAPSGGLITANAITQDASADANGIPTWARCVKSDAATGVMDVAVGIAGSGADAIIDSSPIVAGLPINVTSFTYRRPKSAS